MISIWGCTVKDQTCNAIGEFTVAWAQFEVVFFNNNYNAKASQQIIVNRTDDKTMELVEKARDALIDYGVKYDVEGDLLDRLFIRENEKHYNNPIKKLMSCRYQQMPAEERVKATIYISNRIRNNMLHGLKDIATLDFQISIFKSLSHFLKHIIEMRGITVERYTQIS